MNKLLAIFLVLASLSASATTWYVRPSTAEYGAEDGSSYADAFDGLGDITWGVGGVQAGDTLKVCGTFLQTSANTANTNLAMMQVAASGSDGSPIIIDGDCSSEGDSAIGVLDGDYTSGSVIRTRENTYITLRNLDLSGAKDAGITAYLAAASETATAKHIRVESTVTIRDIHGGASNKVGINLSGTNFTIGDYSTTGNKIRIYDIGTDAIFCYSCGALFVDGATIEQISTDDTNGDCVQLQRNASGDRVWDVYCNKGNNDAKQGVVVSTLDSQAYIIDIARLTYIGAGGTVSNGVYAEGQTTVRQSYIKDSGNYSLVAALNNSAKLTAIGNILVGATNGCIDGHKTSAGGTVEAYNNTLHDCGLAAVDLAAATASHIIKNNTITGDATVGIYRGASSTLDDYNNVYGPTTPYSDNGVAGSASANDKASAPQFIGGHNPTTAEGFKLFATSSLCGAGYPTSAKYDYANKRLGNPPNIGAYGTCTAGRTSYSTRSTYVAR